MRRQSLHLYPPWSFLSRKVRPALQVLCKLNLWQMRCWCRGCLKLINAKWGSCVGACRCWSSGLSICHSEKVRGLNLRPNDPYGGRWQFTVTRIVTTQSFGTLCDSIALSFGIAVPGPSSLACSWSWRTYVMSLPLHTCFRRHRNVIAYKLSFPFHPTPLLEQGSILVRTSCPTAFHILKAQNAPQTFLRCR